MATQGLLPRDRRAAYLATRRAVHLSHLRLTAGSTPARPEALGDAEQEEKCQAASTRERLEAALPALVMPPRDAFSPLECPGGPGPPARRRRAPNGSARSSRPRRPGRTP